MTMRDRRGLDPIPVGLLVVRAVVVLLTIRAADLGRVSEDVRRFSEIAHASGVPYRTLPVEYAPIEVIVIRLLGGGGLVGVAARVAVVACVCDVVTWWLLSRAWGTRASTTYLLLGTPLLLFSYTRLDLVPVALATAGAAALALGRARTGGLAFAASVMAKLWPLVVLPALWVGDRRRARRWAIGGVAVGLTAWLAFGGIDGMRQVVSFRGASGWEIESVVGSVVWTLTGGSVRLEAGAPRVGSADAMAKGALAVVLIAVLVLVWWRASRWRGDAFGSPSVAAVAALIACAPIFSLQYAAWLLPWASIAVDDDRRTVYLVAAVEVLTGLLFVLYSPSRLGWSQVAILLRNAFVVAIPVVWLWFGWREPDAAEREGVSP